METVADSVDDLVLIDESPDQERIAIGKSRLEHLTAGFQRLDPKTRAIVQGRRVDGLSTREVALREGVSVSAVEKRLAKAMLFLSAWMRNF
ncbi:hypothetical protein L288_17700 [Sphingobium quisquiliarum P25]|uniref:RNA polymerase sigma factor 70 region 4 type 2 domain-containing protein n=2 Tax=Sphingobium quisquiliarum TaxID=538379 RepID=T0HQK2_9SPHN|nr:hypothetical protein L288_17700 [Sphingobium quisquiliarum P25]